MYGSLISASAVPHCREGLRHLVDAKLYHVSECGLQLHEDNRVGHHYRGCRDQNMWLMPSYTMTTNMICSQVQAME